MSTEPLKAPQPILRVVDPDTPDESLTLDELGSRIVGMAGRLAAATCRWLLLVAQFEARDGHASLGLRSTARWLSHTCGLAHRTAIDHVRVARALAGFLALATAMESGRLSYTHARAIARAAHDGEEQLVNDLIEVAANGTSEHLETVVRGLRTVEHNDEGSGDPPPEEYVRQSWASNSQWRQQVRLDPERGAVVQAAIEQLARAEGISHADAVVLMAETTIAALSDREHPPRPLRGDERAAVVIHVDAENLLWDTENLPAAVEPRSDERGRPVGRIAGGPGLPRPVLERLTCQGRARVVLQDGHGHPLDLGRSQRVVSERQFRVLLARHDGHCEHPGCTSKRALEGHHVQHWLYGGRTDLDNLILLCQAHHLGHHTGEFRIRALGGQRFRFTRSDGRELADHIDPGGLIATSRPIEDDYSTVRRDAARTAWTGERLDRHYAVSTLAQRRDRQRARSA